MLRNHLKIALRSLLKHRNHTFINIFGLGLGMAACLALFQYVSFERSYDSFHEHSEQIYRVKTDYVRNGEVVFDVADNFAGVAPALKREIPDVIASARLYNEGAKYSPVVQVSNGINNFQSFKEAKLFFADASFLSMFSFPLIQGDSETALAEPNTAVITESTAKRYFGDEHPIGKTFRLTNNSGNEHFCTVTGLLKDVPQNSHLKFEVLISYKTLHQRNFQRHEESWSGRDLYLTYIQLKEGANPEAAAALMPAIRDKYKPRYAVFEDNGERLRINNFVMQPLESIHMQSNFLNEAEPPGNPGIVNLLEIIAIFILVIAWVNYVNLTTARALERAKEVGIRKVVGSTRAALVRQFFIEAFVYNILAAGLAILIISLGKGLFEDFIGQVLPLGLTVDPIVIVIAIGVLILGTFATGLYPALVLSAYRPVNVLKGSFKSSATGNLLRKNLTIFQFAASVALIAGTFGVYQQIQFMRSQDLGFNEEQVLVIEQPNLLDSTIALREARLDRLERALEENPAVSKFTRSVVVPGTLNETGIVVKRVPSSDLDDAEVANFMYVDENYIETYEMELLAGDYFSKSYRDSAAVVLTESAARMLDFQNPEEAVNDYVYLFGRQQMQVRGVVKDFHQESLREETNPTLFLIRPEVSQYFSLKLSSNNINNTISSLETSYQEIFPGSPFEFFFMDEYFNRLYQNDVRSGRMIAIFACLSIFIACLGLFGLASFTIVQRAKEIGVRKVLGASFGQILSLLTKSYSSLLLIASIIGLPLAYFLTSRWIENYAFRITLGWWFFVTPIVLMFFIALLSVSYQSVRAALANPVEALKQE